MEESDPPVPLVYDPCSTYHIIVNVDNNNNKKVILERFVCAFFPLPTPSRRALSWQTRSIVVVALLCACVPLLVPPFVTYRTFVFVAKPLLHILFFFSTNTDPHPCTQPAHARHGTGSAVVPLNDFDHSCCSFIRHDIKQFTGEAKF